jgi:hypothetical protein
MNKHTVASALDALEQAECTGSKSKKIEILKTASKNPYLKVIIDLAVSDERFFVKKLVRNPKASTRPDEVVLDKFEFLLKQCTASKLSGDAARDALNACASHGSKRLFNWLQRILEKNLRIGMDSGFNKVYAGSVSKYGVPKGIAMIEQKTGKRIARAVKMITFPCLSQPKRDGWNITFRLNFVAKTAEALSSSGKTLPALAAHALHMYKVFETTHPKLARGTIMVTGEGEATYNPKKDSKHWKSVWGKTSAMAKAGMSKGSFDSKKVTPLLAKAIADDLNFILYDVYPESAHVTLYETSYRIRLIRLRKLVKNLRKKKKNFSVIPTEEASSWKDLDALHRKWMKQGQEGSIIRMPETGVLADSKWRGNYVKWKDTRTLDAVIIGVNAGSGRNKNVAGAYVLWILDQQEEAKSTVLGDAAKAWAMKNKTSIIGYRVEVIAQKDNNGNVAKVRNPVIARYRDDQPPMSAKELEKLTGRKGAFAGIQQMEPSSFGKAVARFMNNM